MKCQCPIKENHPEGGCQNEATEEDIVISPALCDPCLYGCMQ